MALTGGNESAMHAYWTKHRRMWVSRTRAFPIPAWAVLFGIDMIKSRERQSQFAPGFFEVAVLRGDPMEGFGGVGGVGGFG